MTLPTWIAPWCVAHLGSAAAEALPGPRSGNGLRTDDRPFEDGLFGVRLDDGREVALKARPDEDGRVATCLQVQRLLAQRGFPCAVPLTGLTVHEGVAIHAEQWRPGGEMLRGDDPATAETFAVLLARLVVLAADIEVGGTAPGAVPPPLPNPEWVRWDHPGAGHWPDNPIHDVRLESHPLPDSLAEIARRVRVRLARSRLPRVFGHADWETQNLRWLRPGSPAGPASAAQPWVVHDWDSMAWLPEAAIAGTAAGCFASAEIPTLAPVAGSAAFLAAYQRAARPFSAEESEVAWAASMWPALHNARAEVLWDQPQVALTALFAQADERLKLAGI